MKLIVGLGNPGKEYENTRHNIGFIFIDKFAQKLDLSINKEKFNGKYVETVIDNQKIILLKPLSYMNLSGEVISKFIKFYKIDIDDILIISDDLDMNFGKIKLKACGSSGGHNGLKNIELNLGTQKFKRLKIGISNNKLIDTKDYVLGKFTSEENLILKEIEDTVLEILNEFPVTDFEKLMSKYNKK